MECRHCLQKVASRPKGLCTICYYIPRVRRKYPTLSKHGRRGLGNFFGYLPLPSQPTRAKPGSPEKVSVLARRAHHHQHLWHPHDA